MTDGILLRECLEDPLLTKYALVMIDEAHERCVGSTYTAFVCTCISVYICRWHVLQFFANGLFLYNAPSVSVPVSVLIYAWM